MAARRSAKYQSLLSLLTLVVMGGALGVVLGGDWTPKATGIGLGLTGVVGFVAMLGSFGALQSVVMGGDGRISTSKSQAALWTLAIGFGMLVSLGYAWATDHGESWGALLERTFGDEYLLLLGGPYVALVGSRAIVGSQLNKGKLQKTAGDTTDGKPRIRDLLADDDGNFDIVDCQYVFFTGIALVYFVAQMVVNPGSGLPALPSALALLTTGSTGTFLGTKLAGANPAAITSVRPDKVSAGSVVIVYGRNLTPPGSGTRHGDLWLDSGATLTTQRWDGDEVHATVPVDAPVGQHMLHLRTPGGGEDTALIDVVASEVLPPGPPVIEEEEPPTEAPAAFYGADDPLAGLPDDDADAEPAEVAPVVTL